MTTSDRVFVAGIVEKTLRSTNKKFAGMTTKKLRQLLKAEKGMVTSQEINTFLVLSGEVEEVPPTIIPKIEGELKRQFDSYYRNNIERYLQKALSHDQELAETSEIVLDFLRLLDRGYDKEFTSRMKTITSTLPKILSEIAGRSFITVWETNHGRKGRFFLAGNEKPFEFPTTSADRPFDMTEIVDKLLIVNFFKAFLEPTMERLGKMKKVLDRLEAFLANEHYMTKDPQLQPKAELFLRILTAKLSALSDLQTTTYRIFNLFMVPRILLSQLNLESDMFVSLNQELDLLEEQVTKGKAILHSVSHQITDCQRCLRDYLVDDLMWSTDVDQFKAIFKPLADLSVNLFVESEVLKMWVDFFGSDLPHFSFDSFKAGSADLSKVQITEGSILSVRGLFKNYNLGTTTVYALRGVNLDVFPGDFLVIMGSSGAGKTTLLNCMAGLDTPDRGLISFRGQELSAMSDGDKSKARLLDMGFIFQNYALLPHYTAKENVTLPADFADLSNDLAEHINQLLINVGIDLQAQQFPAQLSGGQMQRVAIARALTNKPNIIFADEPTGDLDSVTGKQVMDLLKKFHEETGTTVVVITHDPEVASYATRQIEMRDGVLVSE